MLIKKSERHRNSGSAAAGVKPNDASGRLDRRNFLKRSGIAAGALGALGNLPLGGLRKAEAGPRVGLFATTEGVKKWPAPPPIPITS